MAKKRSRSYIDPKRAIRRALTVLEGKPKRPPPKRALCALSDRLNRVALQVGSGQTQRDALHYQRLIERKAGGCGE